MKRNLIGEGERKIMLPSGARPPNFQKPTPFINPAIDNLLNDKVFIEDGISYTQFKPIALVDPLDLQDGSNTLAFKFRDENAFINTKRIFLSVVIYCTNADGSALADANAVSALNPISHGMISKVDLNIGMYDINIYALLLFLLLLL